MNNEIQVRFKLPLRSTDHLVLLQATTSNSTTGGNTGGTTGKTTGGPKHSVHHSRIESTTEVRRPGRRTTGKSRNFSLRIPRKETAALFLKRQFYQCVMRPASINSASSPRATDRKKQSATCLSFLFCRSSVEVWSLVRRETPHKS